ncbi:MAG: hypothetical protein EOP36_19805 [Rubrivivax sp.]|nr:MAG: hypothetical protein EOP36_19805 [Rubrivivax sp.]
MGHPPALAGRAAGPGSPGRRTCRPGLAATGPGMGMNTEAQRQALVLQDLWGAPTAAQERGGWQEHGQALSAGLAAYQGNADATAERVLAATYPTVQALLGEEALAGLARQLWRQHPPQQGDLSAWGAALPDWLDLLPEVRTWPYLPDCARLDWARHTAEHAADAPFEPESLALLGTQAPENLTLELRPGLSMVSSNWPVVTLWEAHHQPTAIGDDSMPPDQLLALRQALESGQAETAVAWRPEWRAEVAALPSSRMLAWMNALVAEPARPLSTLLDQARADFDLGEWLALALHHGWIWRVRLISGRAG